MIQEFLNNWTWFFEALKNIAVFLIAIFKMFFTTPVLPFTILGIISLLLGAKRRIR